jgi:type II secretory pathway component PulF
MPLTFTPGQLNGRAEFYSQLAQLTSAGIGVVGSLNQILRSPPARSYRAPLQILLGELSRGQTLARGLEATGDFVPIFDRALLQAGEKSGRLDESFRLLAEYYTTRAKLARLTISQLLYPVGLLHFGVFVFCVVLPFAYSQFTASPVGLLLKAGLLLAPLYLLVALGVVLLQSRHGEKWQAMMESGLNAVPVLGTARKYLSLARLAIALEALISAGVNVIPAWETAAKASGSPALKRAVAAWSPDFARGHTPAQLVQASPRFPEMFANLYTSGEVSGKLDESLKYLHRHYQDEGTRKLHTLAELLPRVVYLAVMLAIAYAIIKFYMGYFGQIEKATNGF